MKTSTRIIATILISVSGLNTIYATEPEAPDEVSKAATASLGLLYQRLQQERR